MFNRIRNAGAAQLKDAAMPLSKMKSEIARLLKQEGYIRDFAVEADGGRKVLRIAIKYDADRKPAIRGLKRISKPGLRHYVGAADIPRVLGGMGLAILTTPAGLLTDAEARQRKVGGEVVCHVW
jgi:small subunit ribosomal protein S8